MWGLGIGLKVENIGLRVQGHGFGRTSIVTLMAIAATTVPVIISSVALKGLFVLFI